MRRSITLLTGLFACLFLSAQNNNGRLLDWPMKLTNVSVNVKADAFTATTFIEMEFCNPNDKEIEGLYRFELEPGQVITNFQLELNGKYRDGSIEEKWKARNAYNSIVGKRVDPALLQMDYMNHYSLNVYPIPAKGCRKITFTVQQKLNPIGGVIHYKLPLRYADTVKQFTTEIKAGGCGTVPFINDGLLTGQSFKSSANSYQLRWSAQNTRLDKTLSFSIPYSLTKPALCIKPGADKSYFALRFVPHNTTDNSFRPDKVFVFWDVSAGGRKRDIEKEIDFLASYIARYNLSQLTIITFNQQVQDTAVFFLNNNQNRWKGYLQGLKYEGATSFGSLDFSTISADAVLVFSDGKNSFGKETPVPGKIHTWCVSSAKIDDSVRLIGVVGLTGGRYIDLAAKSIAEAVDMTSTTENVLLKIKAREAEIFINEKIDRTQSDTLLLWGTVPAGTKSLTLEYGNIGKAKSEEVLDASVDCGLCNESAIDRLAMLSVFEQNTQSNRYWYDVLSFGRQEKVVTPSTSFIVLEKIDDYIRYGILPPAELQPECDMSLFVKASEQREKQFRQMNEFDVLKSVTIAYNQRIGKADNNGQSILLTEEEFLKSNNDVAKVNDNKAVNTGNNRTPVNNQTGSAVLREDIGGNIVMGTEVVVTAMGQRIQAKSVGYSMSSVRSYELTQGRSVNLQNGLTGKVSGLQIQQVNNGVFGDTRITLRGIRSLTGNNQPLLVVDGLPISLSYIGSINPNDINDVTILKSSSATAIYGPDGVNGALLVSTKRGNRTNSNYTWSKYRLKDRADMDYILELKHTASKNMAARYEDLRQEYGNEPAFYFDVAQIFADAGRRKEAIDILFTAVGAAGGRQPVAEAAGSILETWGEYDEAIKVYKSLLGKYENELSYYRSIALASYQKKDYTTAVSTYYKGILAGQGDFEQTYSNYKAMMLQEMNAIIAGHKDSVDLSGINNQLIRPLDYDLRITLECNTRSLGSNVTVTEPGGKECSYYGSKKANGSLTGGYYYSNYYYNGVEEYQLKEADPGKYRVSIKHYGSYDTQVPVVIRVVSFRKTEHGPVLQVQNAMMDNQYGEVEIAEVKW